MLGGAVVIGRFDWYCRIWFQTCLLTRVFSSLLSKRTFNSLSLRAKWVPFVTGVLQSEWFKTERDKEGSSCVLCNLFVEVRPHCTTCYWSNQVIACIYYTKCVNTKMQRWLRAHLEAVYHSHEFICLPLMTLNKSPTLMNFSFLITSPTDGLKCDDLIRW